MKILSRLPFIDHLYSIVHQAHAELLMLLSVLFGCRFCGTWEELH